MTDLNNTNAENERPTPTPDDAGTPANSSGGAGDHGTNQVDNHAEHNGSQHPDEITDLDAAWSSFEQSHAKDLDEVARSRSAKRFEKHAERKAKEALVSVNDLDEGAFADDVPNHGPRDFTRSSWLDVDSATDDSDFVPPNPTIGRISASRAVFWVLLTVGVLGIIVTVFFPALAGILGTVFGVAALIGGAGLILQHRGHNETKTDAFDDGARV